MYFTVKYARDFNPISKLPGLTKTYDANVIPLILQEVSEALLSSLAHYEMMAVAISWHQRESQAAKKKRTPFLNDTQSTWSLKEYSPPHFTNL